MSKEELVEFIQSVKGDTYLAIEESLGNGFVRLKTAEAERRQAKHDIRRSEDVVIEILRNSRDAHANTIYLATAREGSMRSITCIDDGDGIPFEMHETVFEPRVTSKLETMVMDTWGVHGRGMALYSIRQNAREACVKAASQDKGAAIYVSIDLDKLSERSDQSTFPQLGFDEEGHVAVQSGPHNIVRQVAEFALDSLDSLTVYMGSPAEIVATLVQEGRKKLTDSQLLFCDDIEDMAICLRPALASDASELADICMQLGLGISERTAHRILAGQIRPGRPLIEPLLNSLKKQPAPQKEIDIYRDSRGLKLAQEDIDEFGRALEKAFSIVSSRYYVDLLDEPIIRVGKDAITVKFPFDKEL